jgi:hypothetical protein
MQRYENKLVLTLIIIFTLQLKTYGQNIFGSSFDINKHKCIRSVHYQRTTCRKAYH